MKDEKRSEKQFLEEELEVSERIEREEKTRFAVIDSLKSKRLNKVFISLSRLSAENTEQNISLDGIHAKKIVIKNVEVSIIGGSASSDILISILRGGVIVWQSVIGSGSVRGTRVYLNKLDLESLVSGGLVINVTPGGVGVRSIVNIVGYSVNA